MVNKALKAMVIALVSIVGLPLLGQAGGGTAGRDYIQTKCCATGGYNVEMTNCSCAVITGAGDTCGGVCATAAGAVAQTVQSTETENVSSVQQAPAPEPAPAPIVVVAPTPAPAAPAVDEAALAQKRAARQRARARKQKQAARRRKQQAAARRRRAQAARRTQIDVLEENPAVGVNRAGKQWIGPKSPIIVGGEQGRARGDVVTFDLSGLKVTKLPNNKGAQGFVNVPELGKINAYKYGGITIVIGSFDLVDQKNNPSNLSFTVRQIIAKSAELHPEAFGMVMVARQVPGDKNFGVAMEVFVAGNSDVMGKPNAIPYKAIRGNAIQFTTPADAESEPETFVIDLAPIAAAQS